MDPLHRGMRRSVVHQASRANTYIIGGKVMSMSSVVGSSAKSVEVSSQTLPTRSRTPEGVLPSGRAPTGEVPFGDSSWVDTRPRTYSLPHG